MRILHPTQSSYWSVHTEIYDIHFKPSEVPYLQLSPISYLQYNVSWEGVFSQQYISLYYKQSQYLVVYIQYISPVGCVVKTDVLFRLYFIFSQLEIILVYRLLPNNYLGNSSGFLVVFSIFNSTTDNIRQLIVYPHSSMLFMWCMESSISSIII